MYTVVVEIRNAKRAGLVGPGIDKKKVGPGAAFEPAEKARNAHRDPMYLLEVFFLYTFHC